MEEEVAYWKALAEKYLEERNTLEREYIEFVDQSKLLEDELERKEQELEEKLQKQNKQLKALKEELKETKENALERERGSAEVIQSLQVKS